MTYATRVDGIDVSHWQGSIDWPTVKAHVAGPGFAAWKVSTSDNRTDPTRDVNRHGARDAGFRWRMGYHWLTPLVDAARQADWFLAHYTPGDGEGVMLDAEEDHTATGGLAITPAQVLTFCRRVEAVTRKPVAVYTGINVAHGTIWRSSLIYNGQRIRFLAEYAPEMHVRQMAQPYGFDAWQSDGGLTGTFPGVTGPCDLDRVENPIMFDLACGIKPPPPVQKPPTFGAANMLVNNAETTIANNETGQPTGYPPGAVKWLLFIDASTLTTVKRHLTPVEYGRYIGCPEGALTNTQLTAIPDA